MAGTAIAPGAAAALLALVAAAYMLAGGTDFCLDDAWIHLAYVKSLRLGEGLSYNPGDHETGFSSPLWVFLLALWPWTSTPVLGVKVFGAICHAATAWGAARLQQQLQPAEQPASSAALPVAGLICACDPTLVFAAVSGMEVSLTAALLVWTASAALAGQARLSGLLGACALWARPESLFFLVPWSLLRWRFTRQRSQLWPALGAGAALLAWMAYCQFVSGYPFPNTYYAKRDAQLMPGLLYFLLDYLPTHAWLASVTGVMLIAIALRQGGEPRRLLAACAIAVVAIAASRSLPRVLFYSWRYFAVLGAIPCVAMACAVPRRRALAYLALAPIALASAIMLSRARELQRVQELDITTLHTEPSQWLAASLPADARILVEGAGATRFFLPRGVQVIDAVGLNFGALLHQANPRQQICSALRRRPSHILLPLIYLRTYKPLLRLEPLRTFEDPNYRIGVWPRVERVLAARVLEIDPRVRAVCGIP